MVLTGESIEIDFFAQADCDAIIHAPITAAEYLQQCIAANFAG